MTVRNLIFFCLTLTFGAGRVAADPASAYFQARQARPPLLAAAQISDIVLHPGAYAGKTVEAPALVSGLVTAGDDRTALLSVGGQSVAVPVPSSLRGADWLDSGLRVRGLFLVVADDPTLPSGLRLLAAAPEGEIVAAEQRQAAERAALLARQTPLASRSLPLRRDGRRGVIWVTDPASAGHPAGALSPRALAIYGPYRSLVRCWNRRLSDIDVDKITTSILYFSDSNNIDPRLIVATIIAESDFDISSTSRAGAMGLAQIMPDEAHSLGVTNAYDPIQNIGAAAHLLRSHLDKYGGAPANAGVIPLSQIALTMAAYNAGPGAVHKYHGVPPYRETQHYVARIAKLYREMCGTAQ